MISSGEGSRGVANLNTARAARFADTGSQSTNTRTYTLNPSEPFVLDVFLNAVFLATSAQGSQSPCFSSRRWIFVEVLEQMPAGHMDRYAMYEDGRGLTHLLPINTRTACLQHVAVLFLHLWDRKISPGVEVASSGSPWCLR